MDLTSFLPYASIGLGSYAALSQLFVSKANAKRDQDIALLQRQGDLFWKMVEQHMTTVLHSPHTPDLDLLLEKYQAGIKLSEDEAKELAYKLEQLINDPNEQQGNRAGAVFLLAALDFRYNLGLTPCE